MTTQNNLKNFRNDFYLQFFALLGAIFLFVGKPVPYSNEYSYLLRLKNLYDPNYLSGDITFSTPTNEYWLFDHIFGLPTFIFSIEFIGWFGRILCWSVLLFALIKLGKRWEISLRMISVSIFLWLYVGQSVVADEWIFGGFEAKCVAYICLIFALDLFCTKRDIFAAVLLGLSFAFHPVIGFWGILAAIPAFLFCRRDVLQTLKVGVITGAFSLIGAIPLLKMRAESVPPTIENLRYFELVKFPQHFDPFAWSKSAVLLQFVLMFFCLAVHAQIKNVKPPKLLIAFLTMLGIFFAAGILSRALNQYKLLEFTPTRLFAVFIPVFFFLYVSRAFQENLLRKPLQIAALSAIVLLSLWNLIPLNGFYQTKSTYEFWTKTSDDLAKSFIWLKDNTPKNTLVIAPPWRYDFWYLSERAEVVNYRKPIIADVGEWQNRLNSLIGTADPEKGFREETDMAEFYFALDEQKIKSLNEKYQAAYFISESDYSFPVLYSEGEIKIYRLPEKH